MAIVFFEAYSCAFHSFRSLLFFFFLLSLSLLIISLVGTPASAVKALNSTLARLQLHRQLVKSDSSLLPRLFGFLLFVFIFFLFLPFIIIITMPPKQDNVQKLLAAEEKRNKLIADAKNRKQQKVKQAKADAEREVASFRAERDQEYEQYRTQQNSGADAEHAELARETDRELEELKTMTAQRMNAVADKMAQLIVNVNE